MPSLRQLLRLCRAHIAVVVSCAVHLAVVTIVDGAPPERATEQTAGRFVVVAPDEPPVVEPPEPEPPELGQDESASAPAAPAAPPPVIPPPSEPATEPAVEPVAPLDLTGVTLAGDSGSAWSSVVGNGRTMTGPLGPVRARPRATAEPSPVKAKGKGKRAGSGRRRPAEVKLADLSERPQPANLDAKLRLNYPKQARDQQISGVAVVRARIGPRGRVDQVRVMSESYEGFGGACSATLHGSRWSVPRDQQGRPVATWVRYTYRFVVGT